MENCTGEACEFAGIFSLGPHLLGSCLYPCLLQQEFWDSRQIGLQEISCSLPNGYVVQDFLTLVPNHIRPKHLASFHLLVSGIFGHDQRSSWHQLFSLPISYCGREWGTWEVEQPPWSPPTTHARPHFQFICTFASSNTLPSSWTILVGQVLQTVVWLVRKISWVLSFTAYQVIKCSILTFRHGCLNRTCHIISGVVLRPSSGRT